METDGTNGPVKTIDASQVKDSRKPNYRDCTFILIGSGLAAVAAGVIASALSKKRARQYLSALGHEPEELPESGTSLALKALCYSTAITLGTFSISVWGCCKLFDIKSMDDLREKLKKLRKSTPNPDERTEFESVSDFLNYISERYKKVEVDK